MKKETFTVAEEKFSLHSVKVGKSIHYVYQWLNPSEGVEDVVSTTFRSKTKLRPAELLAWVLELLETSKTWK